MSSLHNIIYIKYKQTKPLKIKASVNVYDLFIFHKTFDRSFTYFENQW